MLDFHQLFQGPLVDQFMTLLVKAVEWCLAICCGAVTLVIIGLAIWPGGGFRTNSLPGAVVYFTLLITMFTAFYAAVALMVVAVYRYYRRFPVWAGIRRGTRLLPIAVVLFAALILIATLFGAR